MFGLVLQFKKHGCKKILKSLILILIFFPVFFYPTYIFSFQQAGSAQFEAAGSGLVIDADKDAARKDAISNSLRKCVENAVANIIPPLVIEQNDKIITDFIYSKYQNYIQYYTIIEEGVNNNVYTVKAHTKVSISIIKEELESQGIVTFKKGLPKTLILFLKNNFKQNEHDLSLICEKIIQSAFSKEGFAYVSFNTEGYFYESNPTLETNTVMEIARHSGADLIVVGKISDESGHNKKSEMPEPSQGHISAYVLRVGDRKPISSSKAFIDPIQIDGVMGTSEAIIMAAEKLARDLISQIIERWKPAEEIENCITMTILGINEYYDFMQVREELRKGIIGVTHLYPCELKYGVVKLALYIDGGIQLFADELAVKKFSSFSLEISELEGHDIVVHYKKDDW